MTGFCIHFCIQFTEGDFQLRNLSDHIDQCEALEGAKATRKLVEFGINCKSILTINVPYTLAMRHQQQQCYYNLDTSAIGGEEPEIGPGCSVSREMVSGLTLPTCHNLYR